MALISINLKDGSVDQPRDLIVGIDLGTTNSLVAYVQEGEPICVRTAETGSALVPSVVHFSSDGQILVGAEAKEKIITDPAHTIFSVKRLMGKSYRDVAAIQNLFGYRILDDDTDALVKVRVEDRFYTPVELSALILRALKSRVEAVLGAEVSRAVITVPAYFNDTQRQATRDAGKLAGLDVLRIVNEPTAAALAYGLDQTNASSETIAVYDLGGGTFDISLLAIQEGIFEVLATNGDTFLGGDDFDRLIVDFWIDEYKIDRETLTEENNFSQELRICAESAKKTLSNSDHFSAPLREYTLELSRTRFEQLTSPLIQRTIDCCVQVLADAGLQPSDIQKVVMVGGSTRIPAVKTAVAEFFGRPVYDRVNPDEVVALGAALQADVLAGNKRDLLLLDVTPLSLGIETIGGLMDTIIPRNTKIPAMAGRQYTTSVDGQRNLKIAVYQGERDLVQHNRKLGEFILSGIPPMPAGLPKIDIQFILNADGILTVRARELRSNLEQTINIQPSYGVSEEEMAQMLLDSIRNAQQDMAIRALLEARNEGQNLVLSGGRFIDQNKEWLSESEINTINDLLNQLREAMNLEDKDVIHGAIDSLNQYTLPLAHRAMDLAVGSALKGKGIADS